MPLALSLMPAAWEQDVREGPAHPNYSSGELQHAGAVGKQEARFLHRPSGFNRPFQQSLLPALKYVESSEADAIPVNSILHWGCTQVRSTAKFPVSSVNDTEVIGVT